MRSRSTASAGAPHERTAIAPIPNPPKADPRGPAGQRVAQLQALDRPGRHRAQPPALPQRSKRPRRAVPRAQAPRAQTPATAPTRPGHLPLRSQLPLQSSIPPAACAPRSTSRQQTRAPRPYDAPIAQAAARYGIDPALLHGLIQQESGFDPNAQSSSGALGLTQLMPGTASSLGVSNPLDPEQSIEGGARYLSEMLSRFGGNTADALAAYNAGPRRGEPLRGRPALRRNPGLRQQGDGLRQRLPPDPLRIRAQAGRSHERRRGRHRTLPRLAGRWAPDGAPLHRELHPAGRPFRARSRTLGPDRHCGRPPSTKPQTRASPRRRECWRRLSGGR